MEGSALQEWYTCAAVAAEEYSANLLIKVMVKGVHHTVALACQNL